MSKINNMTYNAYQKVYKHIMEHEDILSRKMDLRVLATDVLESAYMENNIKLIVLEHLFILINQYEKQFKEQNNLEQLA